MPEETFDSLVSILRQETNLIIQSKYFPDISLDLLRFILSENILNVKEDKLFYAVMRWCENKIGSANLPANGQTKRKILDSCEYLIRFGSMSLDVFMECYNSEPDFISGEKFKDIICDIHNKTDQSPFLKYPRIDPSEKQKRALKKSISFAKKIILQFYFIFVIVDNSIVLSLSM